MSEQTGVAWRRPPVEQVSICFLLNLTAVRATSQYAKDDVRRHPVLLLASSVYRVGAPPQPILMIVRLFEAANPMNKVRKRHEPLLMLEQNHVMVQSE